MEGKSLNVNISEKDFVEFQYNTYYQIPNDSGKIKQIIRNNKLLYFKIKNKNSTQYNCSVKNCRFKCIVTFDKNMKILTIHDKVPHSCEKRIPLKDYIEEKKLKILSKEIAMKIPFLTPSETMEYVGITDDVFKRLYYKINYQKKKMKITMSINDLMEPTPHYLLLKSSTPDILIFYRPWSFSVCNVASYFFLDGSWKCKLSNFRQIYVISSEIDTNHFTCFLILMKDKSYQSYKKLFAILEKESRIRNPLVPFFNDGATVITDFEKSCINALKDLGITPMGCSFHYKKSIFKKLDSLNINTNDNIDKEENNRSRKKDLN